MSVSVHACTHLCRTLVAGGGPRLRQTSEQMRLPGLRAGECLGPGGVGEVLP